MIKKPQDIAVTEVEAFLTYLAVCTFSIFCDLMRLLLIEAGRVLHPYFTAKLDGLVSSTAGIFTGRNPSVCPGYVMTPMQEAEYTPEILAEVNKKIPLGRHARPEEIAALFAFLCSQEAAYITGQCYVIDGGETAGGLASR